MTALNYVPVLGKAFLIQDAAVLGPKDTITEIRSKPLDMPEMRGVLGAAGPVGIVNWWATNIRAAFRNLDDLAANGEEFFMDLRNICNPIIAEKNFPKALGKQVLIAGWSESRDAPCCVVFNDGLDVVFHVDPEEHISPLPPRDELILHFQRMIADGGREHFDPVRHGIPLLEAQRRTPILGGYAVGGFVEVCEITREGVSRRIVHRWPEDVVGELITPRSLRKPAPPAPVMPVGLSRHQRRAWAAGRRRA